MRKVESLDDRISKKAVEFADQMKAAAAMADKEEEIRIGVERQLALFAKEAGVKLEGRHEFTVASGRIDSVYQRVIIEYKNPASPSDRIGPKSTSAGTKKVVEQIKKRFYDMRTEHHQPLNTLFGVGLDGNRFVFVRFRDDKWQVQEPVEVNRYSAERFLWALSNLGQSGKPFSPEYLAGDFGAKEGSVATAGIHALYDAIVTTDNPKAQIFFNQWRILFGEVCGYDVDNPSDKVQKLAEFYGVPARVKPAELLFAVHTYYALFMKLLASEVISSFHDVPKALQKMLTAPTSNALKREMEDLEAGGIFRHLNITNFLEGDLFNWYTSAWSEPVEKLVRDMVAKLDSYNPRTLSEDPASSRDLLKKLYHELFPKSIRHDLGEYYTPDWLAEHVLDELGYVGDPDKRLLDPACGSGTFLVMAINRIRRWYDENRETCRFGEDDLCRKILANVIGFDLNPLAVMAARTNYLIAMRGLINYVDSVEIPVYLCDSILTPSSYGDLFTSDKGEVRELKTAAARFLIPTEIANNREDIGKYAGHLEFCVGNGYSPEEFLQRCRDEGLPVKAESLHGDLYRELVKLDKANKNGVWARIIKNAFAPLFVGKVDYVAGNPPWVFWHHLPGDYREQVRRLMRDTYRITAKTQSTMKQLGSASKDLSMLFFYVGLHRYLRDGGAIGFVITQTLFQTTAGNEFRRFMLPDGVPIRVTRVEDWVKVQPFRPKAGNKTAVIIAIRGKPTEYPIPCPVWQPLRKFDRESATLDEVMASCKALKKVAYPSDANVATSFWVIGDPGGAAKRADTTPINFVAGAARVGINTNLESAFRVFVLRPAKQGYVLVRNNTDRAKKPLPEVEAVIEAELVYPFVSGRSMERWGYDFAGFYIVPHTRETGMAPISVGDMRKQYSKAFAYFKQFEEELAARPLHKRWGKGHPFYSLYNIGPYTFAPYRVGWKRSTKSFAAAVLSTASVPELGSRLVLANGKIMCLDFEEEATAHYVCGCLNAPSSRELINSAITSEAHRDIIGIVPLPPMKEGNLTQARIAEISRLCHGAVTAGDAEMVECLERELDDLVGKLP